MSKIKLLKYIDNLPSNYDKKNNPDRKSIFELLPKGVTWEYNMKYHLIENENKVISMLLKDEKSIAIIEAPFNKSLNKAYIINGDKSIKWDVKNIVNNRYSLPIIFSDVYYINNELFFFVNINNEDFRLNFNEETGCPGQLISSY